MSKKYVSRVKVFRQGQRVKHLKNYKANEVAYRAEVATLDGYGTADVTKKIGFTIDYAIPRGEPAKLDWSDVVDEDWVVELEGGRRVNYGGVDCLNRGEYTTDGEKETAFTLTFLAETEVIE